MHGRSLKKKARKKKRKREKRTPPPQHKPSIRIRFHSPPPPPLPCILVNLSWVIALKGMHKMSSKCALHGSAEQKSTHAMSAPTFKLHLFKPHILICNLQGVVAPRSLLWAVYSGRRDGDLKPARFAGSQHSVGTPFHCLGDARAVEITPRATVHVHCFPQIGGGGGGGGRYVVTF